MRMKSILIENFDFLLIFDLIKAGKRVFNDQISQFKIFAIRNVVESDL